MDATLDTSGPIQRQQALLQQLMQQMQMQQMQQNGVDQAQAGGQQQSLQQSLQQLMHGGPTGIADFNGQHPGFPGHPAHFPNGGPIHGHGQPGHGFPGFGHPGHPGFPGPVGPPAQRRVDPGFPGGFRQPVQPVQPTQGPGSFPMLAQTLAGMGQQTGALDVWQARHPYAMNQLANGQHAFVPGFVHEAAAATGRPLPSPAYGSAARPAIAS